MKNTVSLAEIGFTEEDTLLIPLHLQDFELAPKGIRYRDKAFEPKREVHITIVGRDLGRELEELYASDPVIHARLKRIVSEAPWRQAGWRYQKMRSMYHVADYKQVESPEGETEIVHAESIILMVEAPGVGTFFGQLSEIVGRPLEVPPLHVTLYTRNYPHGIGIPNRGTFNKLVIKEVSSDELEFVP